MVGVPLQDHDASRAVPRMSLAAAPDGPHGCCCSCCELPSLLLGACCCEYAAASVLLLLQLLTRCAVFVLTGQQLQGVRWAAQLPGVQDVVRVQGSLHRVHHLQRRAAVLGQKIRQLAVPNAVLTSAGALRGRAAGRGRGSAGRTAGLVRSE